MKEILEDNKYWTLSRTISKDGDELLFLSKGYSSTHVRMSFDIGRRGLEKKHTSDWTEYSWAYQKGGDCLYYENGPSIKFQLKKLIVIHKDCSIIYAETDQGLYEFSPSVYKIKLFNKCFKMTDFCLGIFNKNDIVFSKMCSLNSDSYYHTYYFDNHLRVICQNGSEVKIFTYDKEGLEEQKVILLYNIDELYRLTQKVGNVTYLYSYFIMKAGDTQIILNLKTLMYVEKTFKTIIPTSFSVEVKDYIAKREKYVVKQNTEYLCVDNIIYNEEMKVVASLKTKWILNPILLDCYGNYIAVSDRDIIYILKWSPNSNSKVEEFKYHCMSYNGKVELLINNDYATFDPIDKKFSVDVDLVRDISGKKDSPDYDDYSEYSIMDALDGEPDAYWNID